jgi:hypothetical protein
MTMMIAAPVVVSPAFADRDAVWRMVQTHSPYPLMAALAGYGEMMGGDVSPWFRSNWALDGQKALTFRDEREARVYDGHEDDLALASVVDKLRADLARRGHQVEEPSDPYRDAAWSQLLTSVYMLGR